MRCSNRRLHAERARALADERRRAVIRSALMVFFPVVSLRGLPPVVGGGWLGSWGFKRYDAGQYRARWPHCC